MLIVVCLVCCKLRSGTALVREVEGVLLFLRSEYLLELSLSQRSQYCVPRIAKISCFYEILLTGVKLGEDGSARPGLSICSYGFAQYIFELLSFVLVEYAFDIED